MKREKAESSVWRYHLHADPDGWIYNASHGTICILWLMVDLRRENVPSSMLILPPKKSAKRLHNTMA